MENETHLRGNGQPKPLAETLIRDDSAPPGEVPILRFTVPSKEAPGFLRRQREALRFVEMLKARDEITAETFERIVDFLLPFVTAPQDRDTAREALWDMSKEQYDLFLDAVIGGEEKAEASQAPFPESSASSATG
jgi:hypothetical protein